MYFEIIKNDVKIIGPAKYDQAQVRDFVMRQGEDYRLVPPRLTSKLVIGGLELLPVAQAYPKNLPKHMVAGDAVRKVEANAVVYTYVAKQRPADDLRRLLIQELEDCLEKHNNSYFLYEGVGIKITSSTRTNILGALKQFELDPETKISWKGVSRLTTTDEGYVESPNIVVISSLEQMQQFASVVIRYIERGYTAYHTMQNLIKQLEPGQLMTFDVEAQFNGYVTA